MSGVTTCYFCDFATLTIEAELPINGVKWSHKLNDIGTWSGTLNIADPNLVMNWKTATTPELTAVFVDVDGILVWGGWVLTRNYTRSTGIVSLTATSFWGYIGSRRIQAQDYTAQWAWATVDPMDIAAVVVSEALDVDGSGMPWLNIVVNGTTPVDVWPPISWPISQEQNVGSLVAQLQAMGYGIGFDFGIDCAWATVPGGAITVTLNLSYPVRGRSVADSGLVVDCGPTATEFIWVEDGTSNANHVIETGTSTGSIAAELLNAPALAAGYPLLDAVISNPSTNSTPVSQAVLDAYAADDMATGCYPATPATVTVPLQPPLGANPSITDYGDGDLVRLVVPRATDAFGDPYFPDGLDTTMRIVQIDATPGDAGLGSVVLTLAPPASATPVPVPV